MNRDSPPIEIAIPDIGAYRHGNTGVDYVSSFAAPTPGPHTVVCALMHGNEPCGAVAIDALYRLGVRPQRGRLTLAFVNVDAYRGFDPANPFASRFVDEDMNRVWADAVLDSGRSSSELRRARALRPLFADADRLVDLHSMTSGTEPLILSGRTARARALGRALGYPGWVVADSGHSAGLRLIDGTGFADPAGERTALLIECGQHWLARTAAVALESCLRFLVAVGTVDSAWAAPHLPPRPAQAQEVEVTHAITARSEAFRLTSPFVGLEIIEQAGTRIADDAGIPIVTPYDDCVLIMPAQRVKPGQTAVRLGRLVR